MTLALFCFFVALLAGVIPIGPAAEPADTGAIVTTPAEKPAPATVTKRLRQTAPTPTATTTSTPRPARLATVVVTATRGDCWISARLGSSTGKAIGASGNIDVTMNGRQREIQSGTVAVVLGPT